MILLLTRRGLTPRAEQLFQSGASLSVDDTDFFRAQQRASLEAFLGNVVAFGGPRREPLSDSVRSRVFFGGRA